MLAFQPLELNEQAYFLLHNAVNYPGGFPHYPNGFPFGSSQELNPQIIRMADIFQMFPDINVNVYLFAPHETPLYKAIMKYRLYENADQFYRDKQDTILELLRRGANPNLCDKDGDDMFTLYQMRCRQSDEVVQAFRAAITPEQPINISREEYALKLDQAIPKFFPYTASAMRNAQKHERRNPGEVVKEMLKFLPPHNVGNMYDNAYKAFVDLAVKMSTQRMCFRDFSHKFWYKVERILIPKYIVGEEEVVQEWQQKMLDIFYDTPNFGIVVRADCDTKLAEAKIRFDKQCFIVPPEVLGNLPNPCEVVREILKCLPYSPEYDKMYGKFTNAALTACDTMGVMSPMIVVERLQTFLIEMSKFLLPQIDTMDTVDDQKEPSEPSEASEASEVQEATKDKVHRVWTAYMDPSSDESLASRAERRTLHETIKQKMKEQMMNRFSA